MELLKRLSKTYNIILPVEDFLYILQLEDYYIEFYFKHIWRFWFRRNIAKRSKLENTLYIKILRILYFVVLIGALYLVVFDPRLKSGLIVTQVSIGNTLWQVNRLVVDVGMFIIFLLLTPLIIGILNILLLPLTIIIKSRLQKRVKQSYSLLDDSVKTISIVGSFGKTTVRNYLKDLLQYNFSIISPEGNINTAAGVANWYVKRSSQKFDCFIFETDGYEKGEVFQTCEMFPSDLVIITSIGDQHLERLGNRRNLAFSLLEAVVASKPDAKVLMSEMVLNAFYNLIGEDTFNKNLNGREFIVVKADKNQDINIEICKRVGEVIKADKDIISEFKPVNPDRRGNLTKMHGFQVIDQSYNISLTTAQKSIKEALEYVKSQNKKLAVITAGIPELGVENANANVELGKLLSTEADSVYVLKSVLHEDVVLGMGNGNGNGIGSVRGRVSGSVSGSVRGSVRIVANLEECWKVMEKNLDKEKYVVLLLPELTDLYYE